MRKVYLDITVRVIVDTDLTNANDIVDNLDINIYPDSENVEVYDTEVQNFNIVDSK
jgi:hypothetical protein